MVPERAATLAELRAVREQLRDLTKTLDRQVADKVDAKVAEATVPRKELRRRLRRSGLRVASAILVVAVVLLLLVRDTRHIARLERQQAQVVYDACTDRNARARSSEAALAKLVDANRKDRNPVTARVWQEFIDQVAKTPLPTCVKPDD